MKIEYTTSDVMVDYCEEFGITQSTVECNIDTSSKGLISKLLTVSGDVAVTSIEALVGEAKILGVINYKVICLDLEGLLSNYDYLADFSACIKNNEISPASNLRAKACIIDIDSEVAGNIVKIQSVVDIALSGIVNNSLKCITEIADENIIVKKSEQSAQSFVGKVMDKFTIVEEYESGVEISKILLFDSSAIITSVKPQENMLLVAGEIISTVIYSSDSVVTTKNFNIPFSEEIDAKNANPDTLASLAIRVENSKIVLCGVEGDNSIRIELTLEVEGCMFINTDYNVIEDACSTKCDVTVKECQKNYFAFIGSVTVNEKLSGSAELDENVAGVRRIIASNLARNCITNIFAEEKKFTLEGMLACNVIYEDVNLQICSAIVELPYSIPVESDKVCEDDLLFADSIVEILGAKVKRERDLDVTVIITAFVNINREMEFECVAEIESGEEKEYQLPAFCIYQSLENESLWNIAKMIKAPIESIIEQNPSLSDNIVRGQKIMYYRKLNI